MNYMICFEGDIIFYFMITTKKMNKRLMHGIFELKDVVQL